MKALSACVILAFCLGLPTGKLVAQEAASAKPKAVVQELVKDLGVVPKGDHVTAIFTIKNEGTADLVIHEVRPSCGCTVTKFDQVIAPGASGTVTADLDTANLVGADVKTVTVFTNDPDNAQISLTVKSDVKPYLNASPGYARFNVVQLEMEGTVTQTIWAEDGNDFKVESVKAPYAFMRAGFREAKEEEKHKDGKGRQWLIDLTIGVDAPVGALTEFLVITTNHPKQKTVKIPVSGFVRPVLAVNPPTADFRKIEGGVARKANVLVRNFATEAIKVTGVESSMPSLKVSLEPVEEGRRYRINMELGADVPKGPFSGKVKFTTDSPKMPQMEVVVTGTVI